MFLRVSHNSLQWSSASRDTHNLTNQIAAREGQKDRHVFFNIVFWHHHAHILNKYLYNDRFPLCFRFCGQVPVPICQRSRIPTNSAGPRQRGTSWSCSGGMWRAKPWYGMGKFQFATTFAIDEREIHSFLFEGADSSVDRPTRLSRR
jgi:hypothetical protein